MITGYIKGQNLELRSPLVVADTIDYMTAQFVFQTVDWEGCRLFSHWKCGETNYTIELSDAGKIEKEQHLNLTAGTWTVWIHGERYRDGELIQRITTDEATLAVTATGTAGGSPFPEVPASDLERINAEIAELQDKVGSGGGSVPAGTDLVGYAMISLMGASYDSLEVTSVTFPPDVTDDADQQRMLRAGAVKAIVTVFEGDGIAEAGVLDCISGNGFTFEFAGVMIGKNRTAFVAVTSIEDSTEYQAEVLAVHEGGGSSGGDAMRLKVLAELPYEGTPPIIDMIDFTRTYTFADIAEAYVAGRTITLHTEYDVSPFQYGVFQIYHITSRGIEFYGHYWSEDYGEDGTLIESGWVPAVAVLRADGTLTVQDREWRGYAKQAEVDKLSEAISDLKQNGTGGSGLTAAQISALDGMFRIASYTKDPTAEYTAFKMAFGIEGGETEPETPDTPTVTLTSISATYSGGDVAVGTALTALTGIVVTAHYSDGSTATVTGYTLSGTIDEGSNTITVSYGSKITTFTVTGIAEEDDGEADPFSGTWTEGLRLWWENGEELTGHAAYDSTDYVDCSGFTTVTITALIPTNIEVAALIWYDESKTMISGMEKTYINATTPSVSATKPEGAMYCRICVTGYENVNISVT